MRAAVRNKYGGPEVLQVKEIKKPEPGKNELLVRVHAATVNRTDCGLLWASPFPVRFFMGLFKPRLKTTGTDFAGVVEAIGSDVSSFKPGDRVWGLNDMGLSSHAEYLVIAEDKPVVHIPEGISFHEAVASAEGAHYAINFMNKVNIKATDKVMLNGATGAIGSAMLQLLKDRNIYVTATCDTRNIELIKSLGADRVIDYTREDFSRDHEKYDFVFDSVGKSTFGKCKSIMKEQAAYISSELGPGMQNPLLALITAKSGKKRVVFPVPFDIRGSLEKMNEMLERGAFRPLIDRHYPLAEIREAFKYVASGQKSGNVILDMD